MDTTEQRYGCLEVFHRILCCPCLLCFTLCEETEGEKHREKRRSRRPQNYHIRGRRYTYDNCNDEVIFTETNTMGLEFNDGNTYDERCDDDKVISVHHKNSDYEHYGDNDNANRQYAGEINDRHAQVSRGNDAVCESGGYNTNYCDSSGNDGGGCDSGGGGGDSGGGGGDSGGACDSGGGCDSGGND